ncbi:MAG: LysR family transcriptional regulator [Verrucomicrobiales bacterium]|nr:LysR family transcriptional regulator [Verrucomicrobiales bacterium]MCP5526154.1 LysR family transcriptional regulator [Verrucomicrobiales bacterium]
MNIHHLELFYYVARHGGVTEAARRMPYGIQQPAISAQVIQLEEHLGVTLFHRRPFALTRPGEELYAFIRPFFEGLDDLADRLRGSAVERVRIGASEVVQRDHLPEVLQRVREQFPDLKLNLREGYRPQLEAWLLAQEIDLAITMLEGRPQGGIKSEPLIRLHLALIVPDDSPIRSAAELWEQDRIEHPLITLPAEEGISRHFQQGLARLGVDWFTSLEVSGLRLVETYVANGHGIGLGLDVPRMQRVPGVRAIPLPEFPEIVVGALWVGRRTSVMDSVVKACHDRAKALGGSA